MTKSIMMWKNRFSGETGFVKSVSQKKGYFENTFNESEAKKYTSSSMVEKDMAFLHHIGETHNNEFVLVPSK